MNHKQPGGQLEQPVKKWELSFYRSLWCNGLIWLILYQNFKILCSYCTVLFTVITIYSNFNLDASCRKRHIYVVPHGNPLVTLFNLQFSFFSRETILNQIPFLCFHMGFQKADLISKYFTLKKKYFLRAHTSGILQKDVYPVLQCNNLKMGMHFLIYCIATCFYLSYLLDVSSSRPTNEQLKQGMCLDIYILLSNFKKVQTFYYFYLFIKQIRLNQYHLYKYYVVCTKSRILIIGTFLVHFPMHQRNILLSSYLYVNIWLLI